MPKFFVPFVDQEKQESAYREIAQHIGAIPLPPSERVYSMIWRHDGVVWTATVGETLRGVETITKGRGRDRRERDIPRSTADTVLAIFPGNPGLIAHDCKSKYWNLPILTGAALDLVRFEFP